MNVYQQWIHKSRYARYLSDLKRREHWNETVQRYVDYMFNKVEINDEKLKKEVFDAIHNLEVMPSMRSLMTAGKALDRDNVAGYNLSLIHI